MTSTGPKKWNWKRKLKLSAGYCIIEKYATALPTSLLNFRGFYHFNYAVSIQRESWRTKRWYDEIGSVPEIFDDEGESEQPAWWTLKKEVQASLTSRPHPPESFMVPRPGSPNYVDWLVGGIVMVFMTTLEWVEPAREIMVFELYF